MILYIPKVCGFTDEEIWHVIKNKIGYVSFAKNSYVYSRG